MLSRDSTVRRGKGEALYSTHRGGNQTSDTSSLYSIEAAQGSADACTSVLLTSSALLKLIHLFFPKFLFLLLC